MAVSPKSGARRFLALSLGSASSAQKDEENFLASARAFLALGSLLATNIDAAYLGRFTAIAYGLLLVYLIHSLLALVVVRYRRLNLHAVDILWACGIAVFIQGSEWPFYLFYPFFLFVLLAAAYRWGLRETLATAAICIPFLLLGGLVRASGGWRNMNLTAAFEFKSFTSRIVYVVATAYVVGFLGESEREFRLKGSIMAAVKSSAAEGSVRETLEAALGAIMVVADADGASLALREERTQRVFHWEVRLVAGTARSTAHWEELDSFQHQRYFFPLAGSASLLGSKRSGLPARSFDLLALGDGGKRLQMTSVSLSDYFLSWHKFTSLLVSSFVVGGNQKWSGRLFLFDPGTVRWREADVRFLQELVGEIAPVVYAVYRLRRLRLRAGGLERARIARELHDGVIQTLIATEMQIDVLRRQADNSAMADELGRFQRGLREEILNVRELMQRIKGIDLTVQTPWQRLEELIGKFRRDAGISAQLVTESDDTELPPAVARELLQIIAEALFNVRKHSGARNVRIEIAARQEHWFLVIEDDGRGFDFSGRLSQAELDATHKGPAVIRERVRSIGGQLTIESTPGRGARLEVEFPRTSEKTLGLYMG